MPDDYDDIMAAAEEEEYSKEESSAGYVDESEALLPDGVGMELGDVRKMLGALHGTAPAKDDPMLMQVTILNAFVGEVEKLNGRHNEALTRVMTSQMEKYVSGVKKTTDSLGEVLANTSVEAIGRIFREHDGVIQRGAANARWCAAVIALSALVNVAVFIWK